MAFYEVEVEITKLEGIVVEADSPEQARELAGYRGSYGSDVRNVRTERVWDIDAQAYVMEEA